MREALAILAVGMRQNETIHLESGSDPERPTSNLAGRDCDVDLRNTQMPITKPRAMYSLTRIINFNQGRRNAMFQ